MGGLPVKPKVQGYIAQEVFAQFQEYCKLHGLSQSAGLEIAVAGFLGIKREPDKKTSATLEISILASEIGKLSKRVSILERWKLDTESLPEDVPTADLVFPIAEPPANLVEPVANTAANLNTKEADTLVSLPDNLADIPADTLANLIETDADTSTASADTIANLDVNPGAGMVASVSGSLPAREAIAISSSDPADYLTRKDLGGLLGVSHESIRVWEQSGKLKEQGWEPVPGTGGSPNNPIRYRQISRQI